MTVEKDFKEGDWILSEGHQHFDFSISSTWIPDSITWGGKVVVPAAPLPLRKAQPSSHSPRNGSAIRRNIWSVQIM